MDDALEIAKWFNNHGRALGLLYQHQIGRNERTLTLILPVITRWTAHYLTASRLLEIEKALRTLVPDEYGTLMTCAGEKREAKERAKVILNRILDLSFWDRLRTYENPLLYGSL